MRLLSLEFRGETSVEWFAFYIIVGPQKAPSLDADTIPFKHLRGQQKT